MIGMLTIPGYGLVDTGAQHGVIGSKSYTALCDCLAERGLKPRTLPTFAAKAVGVGGATQFLQSAEVPIGIRGVSGVVTMHVVDSELPFLLPMPFLKSLGMNLDAMRDKIVWQKLGNRTSDVVPMSTGHIAIDLMEFPPTGWQCPHQASSSMVQNPDRTATREDYEYSSSTGLAVEQAEIPAYRDVWRRGRGGRPVSHREAILAQGSIVPLLGGMMQDPLPTTSPPTPSTPSTSPPAAVHPEIFEGPAVSPNLSGRPWKPGNVSIMVHGAPLAAMIPSATIGFAAHVVSVGSHYKDLAGPVFGTRVGIYSLGALDHRIQGTGNVTDPDLEDAPYRVVLYRLPHGLVDSSNADDTVETPNVPHRCKEKLLLASEPTAILRRGKGKKKPKPVHAFPVATSMPSIPEHMSDTAAIRGGEAASSGNDALLDGLDASAAERPNEVDDHMLPWEQDRNEEDRDASPLSDEEEVETPSPDFWPTKAQLVDLKIAHDNNGHPTATDFARMIRLGNGKPELVKWVKHHFRCDDCEAHRKPKARRPSAVPRSYRFNHVVGIDLLIARDPDGVACFFLNVICWGTSLQQVKIVCGDNAKTAENVWNTFVDTWVRVYGLPDILVLDPGLEFEGYFSEQTQAYGITVLPGRMAGQNVQAGFGSNSSKSRAGRPHQLTGVNGSLWDLSVSSLGTVTTTAPVSRRCSGFSVRIPDCPTLC